MKVFSVVGNRPQFIKAAPTSVALRERGIDEVVLHTGQHYDPELSQVFFEELGLEEPRYALDLRTADAEEMRAAIAGAARARRRPDWVLVYGDTNSTLAGALAAVDAGVPLAHVEAGLRSGDLSMPEERNRIETDRLAAAALRPGRALARRSSPPRASRASRGGRRRDGRRDSFRLAPIARERSHALEELGLEPGGYAVAHDPPRGEHASPSASADRRGHRTLEEPVVFPVHPRTRAALDLARARARRRSSSRSRRSATST